MWSLLQNICDPLKLEKNCFSLRLNTSYNTFYEFLNPVAYLLESVIKTREKQCLPLSVYSNDEDAHKLEPDHMTFFSV